MKTMKLGNSCAMGPCMDITSYGGSLYTIQNATQIPHGRVCKSDVDGRVLCEFSGIGNARQIGVSDGVVVISAREDGLWLLSADDLSLYCHYQTVEYATGVTLCSHFAFISCRQYGVEIIDIHDPVKPVHIGLIRIGEVQSACIWNGYLFGGVWGGMNVSVVDIHDLSSPKLVTRIELQGRGDGVVVKDGILYAAIGQHRRGIKNTEDENDAFFGVGNGFEVFDVRDIDHITKIRTEFTDKGYYPSFDTWKTYLCGDYLLVTNSILGLYGYSLETFERLFHVPMGHVGNLPDAVTGVAVCGGKLFVATGRGGLFSLCDRTYDELYTYRSHDLLPVKPHAFVCDSEKLVQIVRYDDFQVLDVCQYHDWLVLACGSGGVRMIDKKDGQMKGQIPTDGFCCSVKCVGNYLFCANASAGFCIYEDRNGKFQQVSSLTFELPILQFSLDAEGHFALLGGGGMTAYAVDLRDVSAPKVTAHRNLKEGLLYGENFAAHPLSDGTLVMFWHRDGLVYFNPDKFDGFREIFYKKHNSFMGFGPENGIDTDGENIYYNLDGGLVILPMKEDIYAEDLKKYTPPVHIHGKFILSDNKVYACQRARGEVTVTNMADRDNPQSIIQIKTNVSCGKPVALGGQIYIPAGHGGLLRLDM